MSGTKAGAAKTAVNPRYIEAKTCRRAPATDRAAQAQVRYSMLQQMRIDMLAIINDTPCRTVYIPLQKVLTDLEFLLRQHRNT